MINDYADYKAIANMTDAQAADVLEKVFNWSLGGRKTGKSLVSLAVLVALERAVNALRRGEHGTGT